MPSLDKVLGLIEALDDDFSFVSSADKPPKPTAVEALAKKLGTPLAPDHRALVEKLGAAAVFVDEKVWPRPKRYSTAPLHTHLWGFEVFGIAPKATLDAAKQTKARAPKGFAAALGRSDGTTVGYDAKGKLFSWASGESPSPLKAKNLFVVLAEWLKALAEDKARLQDKSAEDTWLDKIADLDAYGRALPLLMKEKPSVRAAVIALVGKRLAEDDTQTGLLFALGRLTKEPAAITALQKYSRNGPGREYAIRALGSQKLDAKHVVPTLLVCLADNDEDIVCAAAEGLGNYAEPSMVKPLVAALAKVQRRRGWEDGVVAETIYQTLAKVGAVAKGAELATIVDTLTKNLAPKSRYAALHAFQSLGALGPKAKAAVPILEKAAAQNDLYLASLARRALGNITSDWKPHIEALQNAAKSKDDAVSSVARGGLRESKGGKG